MLHFMRACRWTGTHDLLKLLHRLMRIGRAQHETRPVAQSPPRARADRSAARTPSAGDDDCRRMLGREK